MPSGWPLVSSSDEEDRRVRTLPRRRCTQGKPTRRVHYDSDDDSDDEDRHRRGGRKPPLRRDSRTPKEILSLVCRVLNLEEDFTATWSEVARSVGVSKPRLKDIVNAAVDEKKLHGFHGALKQSSSKISLKCRLRLCFRHVENKNGCSRGDSCPHLHLCPNWLKDSCRMGLDCDMGHELMDHHNAPIVQDAGIDALPSDVIIRLLGATMWGSKNQSMAPRICKYYNLAEEGCKLEDHVCPALHICWRSFPEFVTDGESCDLSCGLNHSKFGGNVESLCKLWGIHVQDRDWKSQIVWRLEQEGWNPDEMEEEPLERVKLPVANPLNQAAAPAPTPQYLERGDVQQEEVCLGHLYGNCKSLDCPKGFFHGQRPYQWQVLDSRSGRSWLNFPLDQNDALEKSFIDVSIEAEDLMDMDANELGSSFKNLVSLLGITAGNQSSNWTADFYDMELDDGSASATPFKLRRLSTPSTVRSNDKWATKWQWFFMDRNNKWIEYGTDAVDKPNVAYRSDVTSDVLEKAYQDYLHNNGQPLLRFKTSQFSYEVYFNRTQLIQKNMDPKYLKERPIRRRPVAFTSLPSIKSSVPTPMARASRSSAFPRRWTGVTKGSKTATLVPVIAGSSEWKELVDFVAKRFNFRPFVKAERIQNPVLYEHYVMSKEKLKVYYKSNRATANVQLKERKLLHPLHPNHVRDVLQRSIDWRSRTAVVHSTGVYGTGSYCYGPGAPVGNPGSGQTWVVVDAYVGTFIKGDKTLTCVSPHRASGKNYDCAVDDDQNPKVFVFFGFLNVYPQYVLTF